MRKAPALIVVFVALLTAGCVLSGKPGKPVAATPVIPNPVVNTVPAPPPQSLSIPQTQVELPALQPVDDAALADPTPPVPIPVETSNQASPGRGAPARQTSQQPATPAANPPAANQSPTPPPATTPAEPVPTIQEIVSAADLKKYKDQAQGRWNEVRGILD